MNVRKILLLSLMAMLSLQACTQSTFDKYFEDKSLRIDFMSMGDAQSQTAVVHELREEPVWGGPKKNLVEPFGYGEYLMEVYDAAGGELIYSRSFCSLFGEWRTTAEAKVEKQAWYNSMSIPFPKNRIVVDLKARNKADMKFYSIMRHEIDPQSMFIDKSALVDNKVVKLQDNGGPTDKVDLVFIAEGYTEAEMDKFFKDAQRFSDALFACPPFDACRDEFNVWAVGTVSMESGTSSSGVGVYKNTALKTGYYTFGLDRYLTTKDMKSIKDATWNVPCDAVFLLINAETYGGGGIYNSYACGTADNERTLNVFTHEFGHSFAGLGDEYFESAVAYESYYNLEQELWEPNITTLVDFDRKWKDLLPEGTPIPTPLNDETKDKLGVFEGGGYLAEGIYRPVDHCMMRDYAPFCPACSRAILRMVDYLSDKPVR
ncbi:MAG: peptidase M64 [Bacteroidales bacterium]|nr:peptidase M64 [Bacteroidales bacterium]